MESDHESRPQSQEQHLVGLVLAFKRYSTRSHSLIPDSCECCGIEFVEKATKPGVLSEGYATEDKLHWVCSDCFDDLKDRYRWQLRAL